MLNQINPSEDSRSNFEFSGEFDSVRDSKVNLLQEGHGIDNSTPSVNFPT